MRSYIICLRANVGRELPLEDAGHAFFTCPSSQVLLRKPPSACTSAISLDILLGLAALLSGILAWLPWCRSALAVLGGSSVSRGLDYSLRGSDFLAWVFCFVNAERCRSGGLG